MDFLNLLKSRRSIRRFTQEDVSNELIMQLLEAAQSAPSAGNCQPWHFYVIKNEDVKQKIQGYAYNQSFIATAPVVFVVCADILRTEGRYKERGRNLYCIQDTAAAIQNILLCAKNLGLGTCWCGAFSEEEVSKLLNLSDDMRPIAIIPVGYSDASPKGPNRRSIEEISTFI